VGYYSKKCLKCSCLLSQCSQVTGECNDIPIIAGIAAALVVIIIVVVVVVVVMRRKKPVPKEAKLDLPKEVAYHFDAKRIKDEKWELDSSGKFHRKQLLPGTPAYAEAMTLFTEHLHGKKVQITKVWAVANPTLVQNFVSMRSILADRISSDPTVHDKRDWKQLKEEEGRKERRQWVYDRMQELCRSYTWNRPADKVPIIPVLHGTNAPIAWKIAQTNFVTLSSLDAGFYGNGMYFSTSAMYTLPYYALKPQPAILICFAIPGTPSPSLHKRMA